MRLIGKAIIVVLIVLLIGLSIFVIYDKIPTGQQDINFNDGGTSYNKNTDWITNNKSFVQISENGTTINNTSPDKVVYFAHSDTYWAKKPLCIEFDVGEVVGNPFMHIYDGKNNFKANLSTANGSHVKIQIKDDISWSINGKMQTPFKQNMGECYIRFVLPKDNSITYKNFTISSLKSSSN